MEEGFKAFWQCFVPLFVAVDAIGVLPMFMALTEGLDRSNLHRIINQSVVTAAVVGLSFLIVGKALLALLGITVADFMVAGGSLLFVISISDLLKTEKVRRRVDPDGLGAVPIGVPLITGPAVLTTSVLLLDQQGAMTTAAALVINVLIAGAVFRSAEAINRILGNAGTRIVSKVASLLLAAIAVMIVRKGVESLVSSYFIGS